MELIGAVDPTNSEETPVVFPEVLSQLSINSSVYNHSFPTRKFRYDTLALQNVASKPSNSSPSIPKYISSSSYLIGGQPSTAVVLPPFQKPHPNIHHQIHRRTVFARISFVRRNSPLYAPLSPSPAQRFCQKSKKKRHVPGHSVTCSTTLFRSQHATRCNPRVLHPWIRVQNEHA
jgi:hypothetical protein